MKRLTALIVGLVLMAAADPAFAQWQGGRRDGGHSGEHGQQAPSSYAGRGPGGYPGRSGMPQPGQSPYGRGGYSVGPQGEPPPGGWQQPSPYAGGGWNTEQDAVRAGVRQRRFIPLGQALDTIRRRSPGRELDAGLEQWDGRQVYRVRWAAPNGHRVDYILDAESGAILSVEGGP